LREDKAFTYGARASFQTDEVAGKFSASASVRNEVSDSSVVEFLYEIDRMTREKVQDTSLQFIKNYMNGSFARSLESPQTIARFALNIERYNLPKDYYSTYLTKLEAVTTDDVLRVAKAYLKPENLNITVVGNREEVAESLAQFAASGEVEFFDLYGQTYSEIQAAPEGMTALDVFNKYYEAIGGIEAIGKINTVIETGTMSVGPMALNYERKSKGTDQMMMSVTMGGNVLQKQVLDGNRGQVEQMGQAVEMGPEELIEAKMQNDMLSLLHLENYNMSAELKGIGGFDEKPVYVVDLMKDGSVKSTYYFNIATGLQVHTESMQETPQGDMPITATIKKYTEAQGVLFPSELIQVAGPQTIEVKLDEIQVNRRISSSEFKVN
jgi:zinc protease